MALKETIKNMKDLLNSISHDLQKAENGNKAASQRVRTGTVKLEKIAKLYRKESIKGEKTSSKSTKKTAKKATPKKPAAKPLKKPLAKAAPSKPQAKAHRAHPRAMSFKRPSAKLPSKSFALK